MAKALMLPNANKENIEKAALKAYQPSSNIATE